MPKALGFDRLSVEESQGLAPERRNEVSALQALNGWGRGAEFGA